jgi:hypothetical protein
MPGDERIKEPRQLLGSGFLRIMNRGERWIDLTADNTVDPASGD